MVVHTDDLIEVKLQGSKKTVDSVATVADLVASLQISGRRFAVEVNEFIIPRSQWDSTHLQAGDIIEIVQAVGGG